MTANEYLLSVKRLDNMINEKLDEVYLLKSRATSTTMCCDGERVQCSCSKDRTGDIVSQIVDMERDIDCLTDILVDTKRSIKEICKRLPPMQSIIIERKYIDCKSFSQIAREYGIKVGKTKYIHKKAVKNFEEIYLTTRYSI